MPRLLAQVADWLFEGLSAERSQTWASEFLQAIAVGADLAAVWPQFAQWLLLAPDDGLLQLATTPEQRQAIEHVIALYQQPLPGAGVTPEEWAARVNQAAAAADAAFAQATSAMAAYTALQTSQAAHAEAQRASEAAQAARPAPASQAAAQVAQAEAAARAAARARALGLSRQAASRAAAKARVNAAAKRAAADKEADLRNFLVQGPADMAASIEALRTAEALAAQTAAATGAVTTQTAAAAVAWAAYAALVAADAAGHLAAAAYAWAAADAYTTSYSLLAADAASAQALRAAGHYVALYGFTLSAAFHGRMPPLQDRLADKLLELLAAAPVAAPAG